MNELRAYADGRWAEFNGLSRCSLAAADEAFGPRLTDRLRGGVFGGEPAQFALYPGGSASPQGLTAWVLGDAVLGDAVLGEVVVGLEIRLPTVPTSALADLGEATVVISSELGSAWMQELWPDRGLVLHRRGDVIAVALGLPPFTLADWESDPLRRWRIERRATE